MIGSSAFRLLLQREFLSPAHIADDAKILGEDVDGTARAVIGVDHVWDAVLEHPGIAGRSGDDSVDGRDIEPKFLSKGDGFASRRDVDASQQLIDHFERGTDPRRVAKFVHGAGNGIQDGAGLGEAALDPEAMKVSWPLAALAAPPLMGASR
jgi:hypothetical protein